MSKQILESKTNLPTATNELPSCSHTTSPSTAHAPINGREHTQLASIHQETDTRPQRDTGTTTSSSNQAKHDTQRKYVAAGITSADHQGNVTQRRPVGGSNLGETKADAISNDAPSLLTSTSSTDHSTFDIQPKLVGAGTTSPDHPVLDTQAERALGTDFDQSIRRSDSEEEATGQTTLDSGQAGSDTHATSAAVITLANNHTFVDTRGLSVVGTHLQQTNNKALPNMCPSAAPPLEEPTSPLPLPNLTASVLPTLYDPALGILAQQLDDLEGLRKAQANRIRILTTVEPDSDGEMRGFGLPEDNPAVQTLNSLFDGIAALEHETVLSLQKAMRKHPLGAWQRSQKGVGEKTLARLLACIGDPYVRMDTNQPRTVSQLWAYCGLHTVPNKDFPSDQVALVTQREAVGGNPLQPNQNVSARRKKGEQSNWSTNAKTRAYLISEALVKAGVRKDPDTGERYALNGSEYGQLYIDRRKHTAVTHPEWTPAHSQNDAMRILSKRLLRNLWRAARDIHKKEEETA
jgi:hypothetical protein